MGNNKSNKKWKVYYGCLLMMLFGFWVGLAFRVSESSLMQDMVSNDSLVKIAVILVILFLSYPFIDWISSRFNKKG